MAKRRKQFAANSNSPNNGKRKQNQYQNQRKKSRQQQDKHTVATAVAAAPAAKDPQNGHPKKKQQQQQQQQQQHQSPHKQQQQSRRRHASPQKRKHTSAAARPAAVSDNTKEAQEAQQEVKKEEFTVLSLAELKKRKMEKAEEEPPPSAANDKDGQKVTVKSSNKHDDHKPASRPRVVIANHKPASRPRVVIATKRNSKPSDSLLSGKSDYTPSKSNAINKTSSAVTPVPTTNVNVKDRYMEYVPTPDGDCDLPAATLKWLGLEDPTQLYLLPDTVYLDPADEEETFGRQLTNEGTPMSNFVKKSGTYHQQQQQGSPLPHRSVVLGGKRSFVLLSEQQESERRSPLAKTVVSAPANLVTTPVSTTATTTTATTTIAATTRNNDPVERLRHLVKTNCHPTDIEAGIFEVVELYIKQHKAADAMKLVLSMPGPPYMIDPRQDFVRETLKKCYRLLIHHPDIVPKDSIGLATLCDAFQDLTNQIRHPEVQDREALLGAMIQLGFEAKAVKLLKTWVSETGRQKTWRRGKERERAEMDGKTKNVALSVDLFTLVMKDATAENCFTALQSFLKTELEPTPLLVEKAVDKFTSAILGADADLLQLFQRALRASVQLQSSLIHRLLVVFLGTSPSKAAEAMLSLLRSRKDIMESFDSKITAEIINSSVWSHTRGTDVTKELLAGFETRHGLFTSATFEKLLDQFTRASQFDLVLKVATMMQEAEAAIPASISARFVDELAKCSSSQFPDLFAALKVCGSDVETSSIEKLVLDFAKADRSREARDTFAYLLERNNGELEAATTCEYISCLARKDEWSDAMALLEKSFNTSPGLLKPVFPRLFELMLRFNRLEEMYRIVEIPEETRPSIPVAVLERLASQFSDTAEAAKAFLVYDAFKTHSKVVKECAKRAQEHVRKLNSNRKAPTTPCPKFLTCRDRARCSKYHPDGTHNGRIGVELIASEIPGMAVFGSMLGLTARHKMWDKFYAIHVDMVASNFPCTVGHNESVITSLLQAKEVQLGYNAFTTVMNVDYHERCEVIRWKTSWQLLEECYKNQQFDNALATLQWIRPMEHAPALDRATRNIVLGVLVKSEQVEDVITALGNFDSDIESDMVYRILRLCVDRRNVAGIKTVLRWLEKNSSAPPGDLYQQVLIVYISENALDDAYEVFHKLHIGQMTVSPKIHRDLVTGLGNATKPRQLEKAMKLFVQGVEQGMYPNLKNQQHSEYRIALGELNQTELQLAVGHFFAEEKIGSHAANQRVIFVDMESSRTSGAARAAFIAAVCHVHGWQESEVVPLVEGTEYDFRFDMPGLADLCMKKPVIPPQPSASFEWPLNHRTSSSREHLHTTQSRETGCSSNATNSPVQSMEDAGVSEGRPVGTTSNPGIDHLVYRVVKDNTAAAVRAHLNGFYKNKRIKSKDDFKHLARKLTRTLTKKFLDEKVTAVDDNVTARIHDEIDRKFRGIQVYSRSSHK